jgi:hypothetical protein
MFLVINMTPMIILYQVARLLPNRCLICIFFVQAVLAKSKNWFSSIVRKDWSLKCHVNLTEARQTVCMDWCRDWGHPLIEKTEARRPPSGTARSAKYMKKPGTTKTPTSWWHGSSQDSTYPTTITSDSLANKTQNIWTNKLSKSRTHTYEDNMQGRWVGHVNVRISQRRVTGFPTACNLGKHISSKLNLSLSLKLFKCMQYANLNSDDRIYQGPTFRHHLLIISTSSQRRIQKLDQTCESKLYSYLEKVGTHN